MDREVVGLGRAHGHQHVVDRGAGVQTRDVLAQRNNPVRLRIVDRRLEQRLGRSAANLEQLTERHRVHAALRQVEVDDVLPLRHHPFHHERLELAHGFSDGGFRAPV